MTNFIENKHRYSRLVLCFLCCYGLFLYFYISGDWLHISVPGLLPSFADFLFILAGSDCTAMGIDVIIENPCDPWGRTHNYGLLWLQIGKLGLTRVDITWVALTINAAFLFFALLIISPLSLSEVLVSIAFLISPAIMLGLERTNADLLIFILLAISFYLIHTDNIALNALGSALILLSAILKLYPIVMLPVLIFYYSASKAKLVTLLISLMLFFLYLCFNWNEVSHTIGIIPNITWHYSMGGELLFSRLGYDLNDGTRMTTYVFALITIVTGIVWGCRSNKTREVDVSHKDKGIENDWIGMLYLCGAVLVVFSFVVKNSFDYRNVFFLFLLPYLYSTVRRSDGDSQFRFIALAIVITYGFLFWAEFLVSLFHQIKQSAFYIRIVESILNWLVIVPIVMFAMQIAIVNSKKSGLMRGVVDPLQKLFANNFSRHNYE